jgi:hypothetical protein
MREMIIAAVLAVLLSLSGCSALDPYDRDTIGFWNQCVEAEAYGLSGFNQFGPMNLGYIKWRRNIACDESLHIREQGIYSRPPPAPVILK